MSTDKSDINPLYGEFDDNNQSVIVTSNIEHIMLIADAVHTVECVLNVLKINILSILCIN